ncbi:serine (or cysteine) peptidase inhibitor, clade H, member 2 isoform X2 [Amia ocellicauda]|uniref:serine (or cysteine) peptidase inhibitor, clade H, member 2 isoform X2 n=1 Tax=Amia ocellicauda TaxID=2972642 RepID=UPI003464C4E0
MKAPGCRADRMLLPWLCLLSALLLGVHCKSPGGTGALAAAAEGTWHLGLGLYHFLRNSSSPHENLALCPPLLASALAAVCQEGQLRHLLLGQDPTHPPSLRQALSELLSVMFGGHEGAYLLHGESALATPPTAPAPPPGPLRDAETSFRLRHLPLPPPGPDGDPTAALQLLNEWAENSTGGGVAELAGELPPHTEAALLANALHLRGLWDREFDREGVDSRRFLGTEYTTVEMMHRAGVYRHMEDLEKMVQAVELPLAGGRVSLVLLLPLHVEPLARLERLLTREQLDAWLERLTERSVAVSLPLVTLSSALDLKDSLAALGLSDADLRGELAGAGGSRRLGGVLHAAALELGPGGAPVSGEEDVRDAKLFYADHGFIALLRDGHTGALLLIATLDEAGGARLHDEL